MIKVVVEATIEFIVELDVDSEDDISEPIMSLESSDQLIKEAIINQYMDTAANRYGLSTDNITDITYINEAFREEWWDYI